MVQNGSANANQHNSALASVLETHDPAMLVPGGYPPVVDPILSPMHSKRYSIRRNLRWRSWLSYGHRPTGGTTFDGTWLVGRCGLCGTYSTVTFQQFDRASSKESKQLKCRRYNGQQKEDREGKETEAMNKTRSLLFGVLDRSLIIGLFVSEQYLSAQCQFLWITIHGNVGNDRDYQYLPVCFLWSENFTGDGSSFWFMETGILFIIIRTFSGIDILLVVWLGNAGAGVSQ